MRTDLYRERFLARVEATSECWLWLGPRNRAGYGIAKHRGEQLCHRIAYLLWCGPIPKGLCVCHHCDNPACVRPDHFFLGTHADNAQDMARKGRSLRGERSPTARLSSEAVAEIRSLWAAGGLTTTALAEMYGVSQAQVSRIASGIAWPHMGPALPTRRRGRPRKGTAEKVSA